MTRAEVLCEYFALTLASLARDATESRQMGAERCEPAPPWRVQLCQARKAAQLDAARQAGLLKGATDADHY
jgi:hypothetical protein